MFSLKPALTAALNNCKNIPLHELQQDHLAFAVDCGLAPLLYHYRDPAASSSANRLEGTAKAARLLSLNQLELLAAVRNKNPALADSMILLKGISNALTYYREPHLRPMGDIDVLVPSESSQRELERICFELGFEKRSPYPEEFYIGFHHSMPLFHPVKNTWIEIHTRLVPAGSPVAQEPIYQIDHIYQNSIKRNHDGATGYRHLKPELNLVYTCLHWAMEHNWEKSASRILDVLYILRKEDDLDWSRILNWLEQSPDSAAATYLMLSFIERQNLMQLPNGVLLTVEQKQSTLNRLNTRILHRLTRRYSLEGKEFGKLSSATNVSIVWQALLFRKNTPWRNLLLWAPFNVLFPPDAPNRYRLSFQWSRFKNLFSRDSR